jgi:diphosphomevalonate decarboxylase
MNALRFGAQAPSNIALIKYMGKKAGSANIPENGSLSMTLNDLCTYAEIELTPATAGIDSFQWIAELPRLRSMKIEMKPSVPSLKGEGLEKVIRHLKRVREASVTLFKEFGLETRSEPLSFTLRTANTFPQGSGIASSASAFAAITLSAAMACAKDTAKFEKTYETNMSFRRELAKISRAGSGSSCRSFEGPFVEWKEEDTVAVSSPAKELSHFVLVVSEAEKRVSSSQAHLRIKTSPLWEGRVARVEERLVSLRKALEQGNLRTVSKLAWGEAWEMHSLFHTAEEPFSYWEAQTMEALQFLTPFMGANATETPPIVTLDAGPNIHIIVESKNADLWRKRIRDRFPGVRLLEDCPGPGARAWIEDGSVSWTQFHTRVRGKWVLAGEHAVLRGADAVTLPHPEFALEIDYTPASSGALEVVPSSAQSVVSEILSSVLNSPSGKISQPAGKLEIKSTIPIGAGLGSSAALCVAMGRWLAPFLGITNPAGLQEFATQLEHRFHGKSSGMDVAAIVAGEPIAFAMPSSNKEKSGATPLGIQKLPKFTFHDTGLRARTSDCVAKVEKLRDKDPKLASQLDEQMSSASKLAVEGLLQYNANPSQQALETIATAMRRAQECYYSWQLIPSQAQKLEDELRAQGALATKITGAGDGGMIVALWGELRG